MINDLRLMVLRKEKDVQSEIVSAQFKQYVLTGLHHMWREVAPCDAKLIEHEQTSTSLVLNVPAISKESGVSMSLNMYVYTSSCKVSSAEVSVGIRVASPDPEEARKWYYKAVDAVKLDAAEKGREFKVCQYMQGSPTRLSLCWRGKFGEVSFTVPTDLVDIDSGFITSVDRSNEHVLCTIPIEANMEVAVPDHIRAKLIEDGQLQVNKSTSTYESIYCGA